MKWRFFKLFFKILSFLFAICNYNATLRGVQSLAGRFGLLLASGRSADALLFRSGLYQPSHLWSGIAVGELV